MKRLPLLALVSVAALALAPPASAAYLGPSPYLQTSDSPFFPFQGYSYFYLGNFEHGRLDAPGVSASTPSVTWADASLRDSAADAFGVVGDSRAAARSYDASNASVTFTFDPRLLGVLPTHAGIVWTDPGIGSVADVRFEAFDQDGRSLGVVPARLPRDGPTDGGVFKERFFGVTHAAGISKIRLAMPDHDRSAIDHLEYGAAAMRAPEMSTYAMVLAGFSLLAFSLLRRAP